VDQESINVSRLTSKYQATIPRPVRERLGVGAGDSIAFVAEGDPWSGSAPPGSVALAASSRSRSRRAAARSESRAPRAFGSSAPGRIEYTPAPVRGASGSRTLPAALKEPDRIAGRVSHPDGLGIHPAVGKEAFSPSGEPIPRTPPVRTTATGDCNGVRSPGSAENLRERGSGG